MLLTSEFSSPVFFLNMHKFNWRVTVYTLLKLTWLDSSLFPLLTMRRHILTANHILRGDCIIFETLMNQQVGNGSKLVAYKCSRSLWCNFFCRCRMRKSLFYDTCRVEKELGPAHDKRFVCSVQVSTTAGVFVSEGDSKSRVKDSENAAAFVMLDFLRKMRLGGCHWHWLFMALLLEWVIPSLCDLSSNQRFVCIIFYPDG